MCRRARGGQRVKGDVTRWELGEAGGGVNQRSRSVLQMCGRDQGLDQFPLSSPMFALMVTSHWVLFIVRIPDTKPDAIYLL